MAQTKTRTNRSGSSKASGGTKSSSSRRSSPNGSKARASRTTGSTRAKSRARSNASRNGGSNGVAETVSNGAQNAAQGVAAVAQKAKVPLVAGGAALAGVAGAAVIATRSGRRRKVLGVPMPKRNGFKVDARKIAGAVTDAAKRADQFGQRVSRVASGVQNVSETADQAAKKS